jgi:outer membrane protein TolC
LEYALYLRRSKTLPIRTHPPFLAFAIFPVFVLLAVQASAGQATTLIGLDQAIEMALAHNHAMQAARTMIFQNQAQEITADLRPNPVLGGDAQFIPIFSPGNFSSDDLDLAQQFDLGVSYLFERGHKRQSRLQAARDQTAVTRAQVTDAERTLAFNVGQQFVSVLLAESTLAFALQDLKSFQSTVDISAAQFKAGAKATTSRSNFSCCSFKPMYLPPGWRKRRHWSACGSSLATTLCRPISMSSATLRISH